MSELPSEAETSYLYFDYIRKPPLGSAKGHDSHAQAVQQYFRNRPSHRKPPSELGIPSPQSQKW